MIRSSSQSGFVILFAVLITAIILLIGVGIFRVSVKEAILSSTARESTLAFFASDTGIECALYHDVQTGAFPQPPTPPSVTDVDCADQNSDVTFFFTSNSYAFRMDLENDTCALVTVDKSDPSLTVVESRGFNMCIDEVPNIENPFLLERVLEVKYAPVVQSVAQPTP
jgi:Tfp pilus assembly protein PilX